MGGVEIQRCIYQQQLSQALKRKADFRAFDPITDLQLWQDMTQTS